MDHDTCWSFTQSGRVIFFLTKGDRVVQLDMAFQPSPLPTGLGYYLSDWAYVSVMTQS